MASLRICIDVDDIDRAVAFYTGALGLSVGRRYRNDWVELIGAQAPIDLLANHAGSAPTDEPGATRDYHRHWTPVHLDFSVDDIDQAVAGCLAAGAKLERPIKPRPWGKLAVLADPFGHGFCLLQFIGEGYDAMIAPAQ